MQCIPELKDSYNTYNTYNTYDTYNNTHPANRMKAPMKPVRATKHIPDSSMTD